MNKFRPAIPFAVKSVSMVDWLYKPSHAGRKYASFSIFTTKNQVLQNHEQMDVVQEICHIKMTRIHDTNKTQY